MGNPGFDVKVYPGDAVMAQILGGNVYKWVGYYLKSPNHPDDSWMGSWKRALQGQGWGVAVLYVGLQHDDLDTAHGTQHGLDAANLVTQENFIAGTRIFLDVEPKDDIGDDLSDYAKAWLSAVAGSSPFRPAIYCHVKNAAALQNVAAASGAPDVAFWVSGGSNFSLDKTPADSTTSFASAWQGWLDAPDPTGTVPFNADFSVSINTSPSTA